MQTLTLTPIAGNTPDLLPPWAGFELPPYEDDGPTEEDRAWYAEVVLSAARDGFWVEGDDRSDLRAWTVSALQCHLDEMPDAEIDRLAAERACECS